MTLDRRTLIQTGLAMAATKGRTAARSYTLQVLGQAGASAQSVALGARPITVGAHSSCELVLADPQVSRRHAELAIVPEGIRIKDLGSTNGIDYKGMRIDNKRIDEGDVFHLCDYELRFTYRAD